MELSREELKLLLDALEDSKVLLTNRRGRPDLMEREDMAKYMAAMTERTMLIYKVEKELKNLDSISTPVK